MTSEHFSRRRALQAGGGLIGGAAAGFLLACRDDTGRDTRRAPAGEVGSATTAAGPMRGGRLRLSEGATGSNLNPVTNFVEGFSLSGVHVYDRLLSARLTRDYVLEAAQSVEQPGATTVAFTLKPGLKYQDRSPVSGRAVRARDIVTMQL